MTAGLPLAARTQGAAPAPLTRTQVIAAAKEIMAAARYATLVTLDADGRPQARVVDPAAAEPDLTIWVATNPLTRKVAEVRRDGRVTMLYFNANAGEYVTVAGTATLVSDSAAKVQHWKAAWASFYMSGPRGDDYVLIRVKATHLEVVSPKRHVSSDPKTWRPTIVDLP
ncbi:MAG: pyridoxamine 5'-phosphate oxidase family protein [Gemmatimonadetes bacterium]|nr:pyridoxamine 5'-phosphate oxidase family protein [Gemmatimonadota bacterium]